jgi:hypothetical protein
MMLLLLWFRNTPSIPNVCHPLVHFCTKEQQVFGDGGSNIEDIWKKILKIAQVY